MAEFLKALKEVSSKLENKDDSQATIDKFFQITEQRDSLPDSSNPVIEQFLASAIFLIAHKKGNSAPRAMRVMLHFLRHDPKVFQRLTPNRMLLRKMNLEKHFKSESSDRDVSLEFASFLMRYHVDIDYGDFTDDPFAIQKLRRYENVKYAAELEGLTKTIEDLGSQGPMKQDY